MKYRVYLQGEFSSEVEANSEQEAISAAEKRQDEISDLKFRASSVCALRTMEEGEDGDDEADHKEVEGHCEMCEKPILTGDDYSVAGEDRYYLCRPCAEAGKEEFRKAVAKGLCGYCGLNALVPGKDYCDDCTPEEEIA